MMFPNFPSDRVAGMNHPGTNNATPRMNVIAKAPSATTVCNDDRIVSKFVLQKQNLIVHFFVKSYIGHSDTVIVVVFFEEFMVVSICQDLPRLASL